MPLDTARLLDSDLFALATGDEFKAALALWCKAWQQVPAASLPDDDRVLAHLSGTGSRWKKLKPMALRHFVLCSDGRWYHPVIAGKALEAWKHRQKQRDKANRRWGNATGDADGDGGNAGDRGVGNATGDAVAYAPAMQGTVKGQLKSSVAKATGAEAPKLDLDLPASIDPDKQFWDNAKAYLAANGVGNPGAMIGKWIREQTKPETANALTQAQLERAVDPIPFVQGYFRKRKSNGGDDDIMPAFA